MSASVFVGNLDYRTTEAELVAFFSSVGTVLGAKIPLDRESGRSRGFGFVEFASDELADKAVAQCHDSEFGGRRLRVNKAESRPQRSGPRPTGPRPAAARPSRTFHDSSIDEAPEMDFNREDRSGHGRRDDWRSLRGKKRTL